MRAGKELQSHSGGEGGLGFSVLLPIRWKFLPEHPACDIVFPCLSNSGSTVLFLFLPPAWV